MGLFAWLAVALMVAVVLFVFAPLSEGTTNNGSQLQPMTGTPPSPYVWNITGLGSDVWVAWAPNGTYLWTVDSTGNINTYDVLTQALVHTTSQSYRLWGPSLNPNGTRFYTCYYSASMSCFPYNTSNYAGLTTISLSNYYGVYTGVDPTGHTLVISTRQSIQMFDAWTQQLLGTTGSASCGWYGPPAFSSDGKFAYINSGSSSGGCLTEYAVNLTSYGSTAYSIGMVGQTTVLGPTNTWLYVTDDARSPMIWAAVNQYTGALSSVTNTGIYAGTAAIGTQGSSTVLFYLSPSSSYLNGVTTRTTSTGTETTLLQDSIAGTGDSIALSPNASWAAVGGTSDGEVQIINVSSVYGPNVPAAPTGVSANYASTTTAAVTWTQPGGTILNDTVYRYAGGACAGTGTAFSEGAVSSATVPVSTYPTQSFSVQVAAWNVNGSGLLSSCVPVVVGLDEKSLHLDNFNPMTAYVPALTSNLGAQWPVLTSSITQPVGVYFVGNTTAACGGGLLPFYVESLQTGAETKISCIVPLYLYGYSGMLDSEFNLEYGYDTAFFFGGLNSSSVTYSIELLNLTDGSLKMWNTTGAVSTTNQQADYVGNNTVIVFTDNNTAWGWNLASHKAWEASGSIGGASWSASVEANNIYWLPQKTSFFSVQAHGDSGDQIVQLQGSYNGLGELTFNTSALFAVYSPGITFNWVNGILYNASWGSYGGIGFSAGYWGGGVVGTWLVPFLANGTITATGIKSYNVLGLSGTTYVNPEAVLEGQRYVYTGSLALGRQTAITYAEPFVDFWNNATFTTNRTLGFGGWGAVGCDNACYEFTYAPNGNYMGDVNQTQAISNSTQYLWTFVYAWTSIVTPYPSVLPPPPTDVAISSITATSAVASWTQATGGGVINNTVYVWLVDNLTQNTLFGAFSTGGPATSNSITGLQSGTLYLVYVTAWNGTGQSPPSTGVYFRTLFGVPPAPTGLSVSPQQFEAQATWTQSAGGGILNNTLYLYTSGGLFITAYNLGVSTSFWVTMLAENTTYNVSVTSWNATGQSLADGPVTFTTLAPTVPPAPTDLNVTNIYESQVTVVWVQSLGGGILNNTVVAFYGGGCGAGELFMGTNFSTHGAATSFVLNYLTPLTNYSVEVSSWNATGQSPESACVNFTTTNITGPIYIPQGNGEWIIVALIAIPMVCAYFYYAYRDGTWWGPLAGYRGRNARRRW